MAGRVRFVADGRAAPFETYRSLSLLPHKIDATAAVGLYSYRQQRHVFESLIGDVLALDERADLRAKVEARLEMLFGSRLGLRWGHNGLELSFLRADVGSVGRGIAT